MLAFSWYFAPVFKGHKFLQKINLIIMVKFKIIPPYKNDKSRNIKDYDSFHRAILPILVLVQAFGLLPVTGITSSDVLNVKYKVLSVRFLYGLFTLISICIESISAFLTLGEIRLNNFGKLIFMPPRIL